MEENVKKENIEEAQTEEQAPDPEGSESPKEGTIPGLVKEDYVDKWYARRTEKRKKRAEKRANRKPLTKEQKVGIGVAIGTVVVGVGSAVVKTIFRSSDERYVPNENDLNAYDEQGNLIGGPDYGTAPARTDYPSEDEPEENNSVPIEGNT